MDSVICIISVFCRIMRFASPECRCSLGPVFSSGSRRWCEEVLQRRNWRRKVIRCSSNSRYNKFLCNTAKFSILVTAWRAELLGKRKIQSNVNYNYFTLHFRVMKNRRIINVFLKYHHLGRLFRNIRLIICPLCWTATFCCYVAKLSHSAYLRNEPCWTHQPLFKALLYIPPGERNQTWIRKMLNCLQTSLWFERQ